MEDLEFTVTEMTDTEMLERDKVAEYLLKLLDASADNGLGIVYKGKTIIVTLAD